MRLPLEDIRVVEMGQLLAIPHLTKLMADMGAEVIKVESTLRLDPHRGDTFYGNQVTERFWDRTANFNEQNRNKLGITLDLSQPAGLEVLYDLIRIADVFAVNFRPRVLHNLGLEYDTLRALRPDLVMIVSTGYGLTGPWRNYGAVGPTTEAASGLASMTGYRGGPPILPEIPHTDYVAAEHGLFAVMAALVYRQRTGRGQLLDLAQAQVQTSTLGEAVLDYTVNGRVPQPQGNDHPPMAPHGVYPCAGDDRWIAIAVRSDEEWRALRHVMGDPDWARAPLFSNGPSRWRHRRELDDHIAEWTTSQDAHDLMHRLQAAGVAAGAALTGRDLLLDPHLKARGFFEVVRHDPETGLPPLPYPGRPWRFSRTPGGVRRPAPRLGQHNRYVACDLLGWPPEWVEALESRGIMGTAPRDRDVPSPLPLDRLRDIGFIRSYDPDYEDVVRRAYPPP